MTWCGSLPWSAFLEAKLDGAVSGCLSRRDPVAVGYMAACDPAVHHGVSPGPCPCESAADARYTLINFDFLSGLRGRPHNVGARRAEYSAGGVGTRPDPENQGRQRPLPTLAEGVDLRMPCGGGRLFPLGSLRHRQPVAVFMDGCQTLACRRMHDHRLRRAGAGLLGALAFSQLAESLQILFRPFLHAWDPEGDGLCKIRGDAKKPASDRGPETELDQRRAAEDGITEEAQPPRAASEDLEHIQDE